MKGGSCTAGAFWNSVQRGCTCATGDVVLTVDVDDRSEKIGWRWSSSSSRKFSGARYSDVVGMGCGCTAKGSKSARVLL